ncbi:MAG: PadR family transcriptional regulator [Reichenbachiella sp.]|uniref:PadR family transcriptional regulator n=1 Tax=Reichenbachiella sp. TaxID=2184521 RepID=UPI003265B394
MSRAYLGEFEELVLLIIASLGNEGYAVSVKDALSDQANRKVNISAIHSALYRLEKKGFLNSRMGGATSTRGGKNKRIFQVTAAGFSALQASKDLRSSIWKTIPQLSFAVIN